MVKRSASPGPSNVSGLLDHPDAIPEGDDTVIALIAATGFWFESRSKLVLCGTNLLASKPPRVRELGTCFSPINSQSWKTLARPASS